MYLIIKCYDLDDPYECDARRYPICLSSSYDEYNRYGFEVYKVLEDNTFALVKEFTDGEWVAADWEEETFNEW